MLDLFSSVVLAAFVAALVTNLTVPVSARVAELLGAIDHPGRRRSQRRPTPRLGGLAIVLGFVTGAGFVLLAGWADRLLEIGRVELYSVGLATFLIFLVGVVDDVAGVSVLKKLLVQIAAAWLVVRVGWELEVIRLPFFGGVDLGPFQGLVTILWIVGVTNAINFVDGIDGLAGGVVAIVSSSFLVYALMQGRILTVVWIAAVVGACIGFLRHNWEPARVFMGDSGSLTLGFLLATISVHSALEAPVAVAILVPILALGVPVIDAFLVMRIRFFRHHPARTGVVKRFFQMFQADRRHLHHVLLHVGVDRRRIVAGIYALVLLCCAGSLWVALERNPHLGLLLVAVELLVVVGLRRLGIGRAAPPSSSGTMVAENRRRPA